MSRFETDEGSSAIRFPFPEGVNCMDSRGVFSADDLEDMGVRVNEDDDCEEGDCWMSSE